MLKSNFQPKELFFWFLNFSTLRALNERAYEEQRQTPHNTDDGAERGEEI